MDSKSRDEAQEQCTIRKRKRHDSVRMGRLRVLCQDTLALAHGTATTISNASIHKIQVRYSPFMADPIAVGVGSYTTRRVHRVATDGHVIVSLPVASLQVL